MKDKTGLLRPVSLWLYAAAGVFFYIALSGMFSLITFPSPPENAPLPPVTSLLQRYGLLIGVACSFFHAWKVICAKKLPSTKLLEVIMMTSAIILVFVSIHMIGALSFFLSPIPLQP
jgi:hypothetical protein